MSAQALVGWLTSQAGVVAVFAGKYASLLLSKNIGSVDKLARRLERNAKLLPSLGLDDEYDIERITAAALNHSSYSNSNSNNSLSNSNEGTMSTHQQQQLQQRQSNRRHTFGAAGGDGRLNGTIITIALLSYVYPFLTLSSFLLSQARW